MGVLRNAPEPEKEQVSFWRGTGPDAVEFLKGRYRYFSFQPHSHDRYMVGLITAGAIEVVDPTRRDIISKGQAVLYTAEDLHWGHDVSGAGWSIVAAYMPRQLFEDTVREVGIGSCGPVRFFGLSAINPMVAQLLGGISADGDRADDDLAHESLVLEVVDALLQSDVRQSAALPKIDSEHRAVAVAKDFLENHFAETVSLNTVANACGISRYWLIKAFKSHVGVPPYGYLMNVRVRHASAMLREGFPITDVALACGFADQSHLTRTFKKATGITPGQFRALP